MMPSKGGGHHCETKKPNGKKLSQIRAGEGIVPFRLAILMELTSRLTLLSVLLQSDS